MARTRRRGSTVLALNSTGPYQQRAMGRPSTPGAPGARNQGDLMAALAPQMSVLGAGATGTLTPNVQAYAPQGTDLGGPDSTALIDSLTAEPAVVTPEDDMSMAAQTATPYGGPSGNPEADAALMQAESIYGTPGNESALSAATQTSMLGSSPGVSLSDIVPGYEDPNAVYNRNKLLRMLMEGY